MPSGQVEAFQNTPVSVAPENSAPVKLSWPNDPLVKFAPVRFALVSVE